MYIHTHKHCTCVLTTSFLSPNWKPFKSLRERRVHSGSEYSQKLKAITKYSTNLIIVIIVIVTYLAASLLHSGPSSNPLYIHNAKRRGEKKEREKEKGGGGKEQNKTKSMQLLIQDNECVYTTYKVLPMIIIIIMSHVIPDSYQ